MSNVGSVENHDILIRMITVGFLLRSGGGVSTLPLNRSHSASSCLGVWP
jgi:hypothetical protein